MGERDRQPLGLAEAAQFAGGERVEVVVGDPLLARRRAAVARGVQAVVVDRDLDGGQLNGSAYVSDNTATAPAAITVSGVAVTGSLYCTGNSPAPTDAGTLNTVSAVTASDQCTDLEQQG